MVAYTFDSTTKKFIGIVQCQESPLEPGVFWLPGSSTFLSPPQETAKKSPYWNGTAWELKFDPGKLTDAELVQNGFVVLSDGFIVDGETIREMTVIEKGKAGKISLPVFQSILSSMSENGVQRRLKAGFTFNGKTYQADPQAQQIAASLLTLAATGIPVFPQEWRSGENRMGTFQTADEFKMFAATMTQFVGSVFSAVWATKDAIRSATSNLEAATIFEAWDQ